MLASAPNLAFLPPEAAAWRTAFVALHRSNSPCPHLNAERWGAMYDSALAFIDRFGAEAVACGWTDVELFGVHPEHGTLRVDWCGALMIGVRPAVSVSADRISFGTMAIRHHAPGRPVGVPIWTFAASRKSR